MLAKPTYKVCRRLGAGVFDKCQTQKFVLSEARRGRTTRQRRKTVSNFARQMLEKQRVRFAYGFTERQLRTYVAEAGRVAKLGNDPVARMIEQLEMRLDNVIYRSGLATSRRAARQLVAHGHVLVNGVRTTIPSCQIKEGDTFALRSKALQGAIGSKAKEQVEAVSQPKWLAYMVSDNQGKVTARPTPDATEMPGDVGAILEFYSR